MPFTADPTRPEVLLGGLSPQQFMRRHWQKKPLLIRQAIPNVTPPLARAALFALAAQEGVESRLITRNRGQWELKQGPIARKALPPLKHPKWTLLVQGLDLHVEAAHELMSRFRFVPDARLDDLMVSYASDGGGVGPHFDSYDVFLLQVHGRRRWRIGRAVDTSLLPDAPLKMLANFTPEQEWLLEPGDMLYLPPRWAHDGEAVGECMTCSIGFRAPAHGEFAREVLQRSLDSAADASEEADVTPPQRLYRDPAQAATATPAQVPGAMLSCAIDAIAGLVGDRQALACSLGEWLSEPKPQVWFGDGPPLAPGCGVRLDRRTRMLWDDWHVFINGESFRVAGRDARLMRRLADQRELGARDRGLLGNEAAALLDEWAQAGWVRDNTSAAPQE